MSSPETPTLLESSPFLEVSSAVCHQRRYRVDGIGFRVWGLGFGVQGLGFRVWGLRFRVHGLGFRDQGLGSFVCGFTERAGMVP